MIQRALLAVLLLCASPAHAEGERTQETVPVGEGRFLIFVGAPTEAQMGYTVDLIKVEDGVPYYIPLFIEDYDAETNTAKLGYGVAFEAADYRFSKTEQTLDIQTLRPETKSKLLLHYTLDDDILHLQSVMAQPASCKTDCKSKQLYTKQ